MSKCALPDGFELPKGYLEKALSGDILFGDDFDKKNLERWFELEAQGYSSLVNDVDNVSRNKKENDDAADTYTYHALNYLYGFRHLGNQRTYNNALSIGGAFGDELKPVTKFCKNITILEPGDGFENHNLGNDCRVEYVSPNSSGKMPFDDNNFDLMTCFSCMHHIPNVSYVIQEMYRTLASGGYLLIREPTVTMGDWYAERGGLTPCERGIPRQLMRDFLRKSGFIIEHETSWDFPLVHKICSRLGIKTYNSSFFTSLDVQLCRLLALNNSYYAKNSIQKIRSAAVFFVCKKV